MRQWAKRRLLGLLQIEMENLRTRGFTDPRESVLCINAGKRQGSDTCEGCPLVDFVPPEFRQETIPCLHIRLNEAGETVQSATEKHNRAYLEERLLDWMRRTAEKLQKELASDSGECH